MLFLTRLQHQGEARAIQLWFSFCHHTGSWRAQSNDFPEEKQPMLLHWSVGWLLLRSPTQRSVSQVSSCMYWHMETVHLGNVVQFFISHSSFFYIYQQFLIQFHSLGQHIVPGELMHTATERIQHFIALVN